MRDNTKQQNNQIAKLEFTLDRIISILNKLNFAEGDKKERLLMLCRDVKYFIAKSEPELFPSYIAHNLRELIEKFFNEATVRNLSEKDYLFEFSQTKVKIKDVLVGLDYAEVINESKIRIKRLIEEPEFRSLLLISCESEWQQDVWKLNDRYGNKKTVWKVLGSEIFLDEFTKSYVITQEEKTNIIKNRDGLYQSLSQYAHGSKSINISVLNESGQTQSDVIKIYLDTCEGVYEIFRPFEYQNTRIINKLKEIINE